MDDSILKINGKSLSFKESDIKLFDRLKHSVDEIGRVFWESGKIPDSERRQLLTDMTEGYLSVMIVLHDVLTSSLDASDIILFRRVTNASRTAEQNLLTVFVTAGAAARTQPRMAWATMTQYNRLASCHARLQKRLNGATISALKKTVRSLEEQRKGVKDLGNYLVEIAIFSLQVEENIHILIDDSDILQLEERQISQLHNLLGRVKTLLEWKHPQD